MADDILVTMNGSCIIKRSDLEKEKENLLRANPTIEQTNFDPLMMNQHLLDGLVVDRIIDEYLTLHNINTGKEYQAELEYLCEERRRALNSKYFSNKFVVVVPESEIKNFYDVNKDNFLIAKATKKKDPEYVPYEQVKDRIREHLEDEKRGQAAMKEVEKLKKEYNIKINEDLVK